MIEKMQKVRIIGPKSRLAAVIDRLHELKIIHFVEEEQEGVERGKPLASAEELSEALVKARSAASRLGLQTTGAVPEQKLPVRQVIREVSSLAAAVEQELARAKRAATILDEAASNREARALLTRLGLSPEDLTPSDSLTILLGTVKKDARLREALAAITDRFLLKEATVARRHHIALFVAKGEEEAVRKILAAHEFSPLELQLTPVDERTARTQLRQAESQLRKLAQRAKPRLPRFIALLEEEVEKAEAPLNFTETEAAFLIHGFIPKASFQRTVTRLQKSAKGRLLIEPITMKRGERIPVELQNPEPVESFRFFLDLYSLPSYKEIDPSWFLFLTFPLFFGFMLGDVGYGLTTLLLFWLLKRKWPQFRSFFNILILSSAATMVFGAVFGEFYGLEMYEPLISRNPEYSLTPLMLVAVAIGVLHVNIGLATGFLNEYREHGLVTAILEKGSWFVLQAGVALLGLSYARILPFPPLVGYGVLALSIVMIYAGEGVKGLVELPGIFGNILSYIRLMAIGLASVGLALVINDMAGGFFHGGPLMILVGILILLTGHVINIGIGLLGSFLHSLRLHYVEFFGKFYQGGGIRFKPFGAKE